VPALLHLIVANLRERAEPQAMAHAIDLAGGLADATGVRAVSVGRSDDHLLVATWLADRAALEPFAASAPHMEFVMRGLAPVTARMWSAAVESEAPAPSAVAEAATLWAFALPAGDGVYEWQVLQLLAEVDTLPGATAAGSTVEERERFRAAGVVLLSPDQLPPFEDALAAARARWTEIAGGLEEVLVPMLR
jgi:hypothetical protein